MRGQSQRAFTLVELLVVMAIIGILISLLLPAVQSAREAARRMRCAHNLMQLSIAVQNYESAYEMYPPGVTDSQGPIMNVAQGHHFGWLTRILPYIEQTTTFRHLDFTVSVYDDKNAPVRNLRVPIFRCSSDAYYPNTADVAMSNYAGCHHDVEAPIDVDNNGVFFLNSQVRYEHLEDGSSHTIFIGEKRLSSGDLGWVSGTRASLRNTGTPINGAWLRWAPPPATEKEKAEAEAAAQAGALVVGGFESYHPGGANFALGDGSVHFIQDTMDPLAFQQLGHRADGKLPQDPW